MDFKRNSVIAAYLAGKSVPSIVRELQHLSVNKMFAYRTINRYNDTGSVKKRYGGGRKKTATNTEMVRKVKKRIERNPKRSANKMAKELNVSRWSIQQILKNELLLKPYKIQKVHDLNATQMKLRLDKAQELKRLAASGEIPNIVFSDEKIFTIEQYVNKQNDRVWLHEKSYENLNTRFVTRRHSPAQVMVWAAVTADGRSPLVFLEPGVKMNATYYREKVLEAALKPWADKHFGRRPWTFQQDSAPSHKARVNQEWLKNHVPHFISAQQWMSNSPDANPMDFSIWAILENKVNTRKYESLDALKSALVREWKKIPQTHLRAACDSFFHRLDEIIRAKGGYIEQ
ncbi:Transposable element Tc3 transposase [Anthophora retusa]